MFNVTLPLAPPPIKPVPAITSVISALVFVFVMVTTFPLLDTVIPAPPWKDTLSAELTASS